jgi:peptidoglycan/xylan/chitin deacetylase (PgdA/CDA1 family)
MRYKLSHIFKEYFYIFLSGIILLNTSCRKETGYEISLDGSSGNPNSGVALTNLQPGIALTFDDSYYDEWIEMLPILNKYNAKVTFLISPNYPVNDKNSKEKILKLYNAGNEIGLHTMNHPHLSTYLKNHSINAYYKNEILPGIRFLNSIGIKPGSFSYPYGQFSDKSNKLLSEYFNKIRGMYGPANIKKPGKVIGASVIRSTRLKEYKDEILFAKTDSSIWVLAEHRPVKKITGADTFTYDMLDSICRIASRQNMRFYCLREIDFLPFEKLRIK